MSTKEVIIAVVVLVAITLSIKTKLDHNKIKKLNEELEMYQSEYENNEKKIDSIQDELREINIKTREKKQKAEYSKKRLDSILNVYENYKQNNIVNRNSDSLYDFLSDYKY